MEMCGWSSRLKKLKEQQQQIVSFNGVGSLFLKPFLRFEIAHQIEINLCLPYGVNLSLGFKVKQTMTHCKIPVLLFRMTHSSFFSFVSFFYYNVIKNR